MGYLDIFIFIVVVSALVLDINARKHHLDLEDEERGEIVLSTFGYLRPSILHVNVSAFNVSESYRKIDIFGFSLDKSDGAGISPYLEEQDEKCVFKNPDELDDIVLFKFDFDNNKVEIIRISANASNLMVFTSPSEFFKIPKYSSLAKGLYDDTPNSNSGTQDLSPDDGTTKDFSPDDGTTKTLSPDDVTAQDLSPDDVTAQDLSPDDINTQSHNITRRQVTSDNSVPPLLTSVPLNKANDGSYNTEFVVVILTEKQEGLYNLYFHNCAADPKETKLSFQIDIIEKNYNNYLSAGEIYLPRMYMVLCAVFLISGSFWFTVLRKRRDDVYKIHYLMLVLVYIKSMSLLFHAINFHFISVDGSPIEAWAVLYYITHLLKGALLFVTIVLIGTGWAFIKHVLSDKDKKIFMIVIPLQVLANVAYIIIESTEEGNQQYGLWKEIFILVDLLCCGAILFPVVWSIRHLQEASQTDGKAVINLAKLKLFRHFYVMVVCYIYITRIIVYLLEITVPYKFEWMDELLAEIATFVFFVVTAYKFRPGSDNPYLRLPQNDDSDSEIEMDEIVTTSGVLEGVKRINSRSVITNGDSSSSPSV